MWMPLSSTVGMRAPSRMSFADTATRHNADGSEGRLTSYNWSVTANFESITESAPLVRELRARIERGGPISFRDFMEAALYHPRFGYYSTSSGATGRGGDFVTSPE